MERLITSDLIGWMRREVALLRNAYGEMLDDPGWTHAAFNEAKRRIAVYRATADALERLLAMEGDR